MCVSNASLHQTRRLAEFTRACRLLGRLPTPDILIARKDIDEGRELGRELASRLELPFEEVSAPY